jgi:hypothetical protein
VFHVALEGVNMKRKSVFSKYYINIAKSISTVYGDSIDDFSEIVQQVSNWHGSSYDLAQDVVSDALKNDGENVFVFDGSELIALGNYKEFGMSTFYNYFPKDIASSYRGVIYLKSLAGIGRGGAVLIIKMLIELSKLRDMPIFLISLHESKSFYEHVGFVKSPSSSSAYYWIPS